MAKRSEESDGGRKAAIDRARRKFNEKRQGEGMRSATMWTRFPKGAKGLAIIQLEGCWPEDALSGRHPLSLTRGEDGRISIRGLDINADGLGCGIEVDTEGCVGMSAPVSCDCAEAGHTCVLESVGESSDDPFGGWSQEEWEAEYGEYRLRQYVEQMGLDLASAEYIIAGIRTLAAFKGYLLELGFLDENLHRKDPMQIDEAYNAYIDRIDKKYPPVGDQMTIWDDREIMTYKGWEIPMEEFFRIEMLPRQIWESWGKGAFNPRMVKVRFII